MKKKKKKKTSNRACQLFSRNFTEEYCCWEMENTPGRYSKITFYTLTRVKGKFALVIGSYASAHQQTIAMKTMCRIWGFTYEKSQPRHAFLFLFCFLSLFLFFS